MSNLGLYQTMVKAAKRVGGPVNLLLLAGATGAAIYKISEMAVKQGARTIKNLSENRFVTQTDNKLYSVTSQAKSNEWGELAIGDRFCVLEVDGDAVLIEKIGDSNNPYFVSAKLLHTISDYKDNGGMKNGI